jgi:iron complex transport system permease protein
MNQARSAVPGFAIAIAVLIAGLLLALTVGRYPVGLSDLLSVLYAKLAGHRADVTPAVQSVILQVRGPRVMAAMLVGAALAVAGTAFQGLFRNPLVSPDILGASSGAALGAVVGIYLALSVFAIQTVAFVGGLIAVGVVYVIGTSVRSRDPILVLVLTGVSLSATGAPDLLPLFGPVAAGTAVLVALRWRMNVMSLPEEEARALGVATGPLRIAIVAAATLVTSASVATSSAG